MAHKPIHLKPAKGRTTAREAVWAAIRKLKQFSAQQLEKETRQEITIIRAYLSGLAKAGYIQQTSADQNAHYARSYPTAMWELVRDVGVDAPRVTRNGEEVTQGRSRENMWRTLKILSEFDYVDLAIHASTEEHPVDHEDAKSYVKYLHKAGYLVMTQPARTGNKHTASKAKYRFVPSKNTGPLPPMVQRIKQVYDPNLGEAVWSPDPEGEEA